MGLATKQGDVMASKSQALLLTADGANRALTGSVTRQFERQYSEAWTLIQRRVRYPFQDGSCVAARTDGLCPWSLVVVASTLNHTSFFDDSDKGFVVRRATKDALLWCIRFGMRSLATPLLQGGWRLSGDAALIEMKFGFQLAQRPNFDLEIYYLAKGAF